MKEKKNDRPLQNPIINHSPYIDPDAARKYFYYVLERHEIYMRRKNGKEFPWTDNKILQENSFTCNRRQDDRTSRWLIDHISNNPDLSFEDRVWRSMLFRLYNKIKTAELIHLDSPDFWDHIEEYADILDAQTDDVYTRAFKTVSLKYQYRDQFPDRNWRSLRLLGFSELHKSYNGKVPTELLGTAQEALDWVRQMPGVGGFMGYQLVIDLTYIDEIPYSNNWFVIAGPGCKTGMDFFMPDRDGMTYEEAVLYVTMNFEMLCRMFYDKDFDYSKIHKDLEDENCYSVSDIQNTYCEYGKFRYLLEDRHKNKRAYKYNG